MDKREADESVALEGDDSVKKVKVDDEQQEVTPVATDDAAAPPPPAQQQHHFLPTESAPMGNVQGTLVMFIRNCGFSTSPDELVHVMLPFGIVKMLQISHKGQAFVQFTTVEQCAYAVQYFKTSPPMLGGMRALVEFGRNYELTRGFTVVNADGSLIEDSSNRSSQPSRIVLLTVHKSPYPITIQNMHQCTSRYGRVLRIVLAGKKPGLQNVLVEFDNVTSAVQCYSTLNRSALWSDQTGIINCHYSHKQERLNVSNNGPTRWDYTVSAPTTGHMAPPLAIPHHQPQPYLQQQQLGYHQAPMDMGGGGYQQQQHHQQQAYVPQTITNTSGSVLSITDLPGSDVDIQHVFNLFGCYGNVLKILFPRQAPNTALVEFGSKEEAIKAFDNLNGITWFSRPIKITFSSAKGVTLTLDTVMGANPSGRDYTVSQSHRFTGVSDPLFKRAGPPSARLLVTNIDASVDKDSVANTFGRFGEVVSVSMATRGEAIVEMGTVQDAVEVLSTLHNNPFHIGFAH